MSSWKNAHKSHRRIHKERSQPRARKHLGLLQKHKDYLLRARNYHRKQDLLKILREKAQNRNPDEFYFRMISEKTTDGRHVVDKDEKLSKDELKLLRSQDLNYVNFKLAGEKKKIERLRAQVQLIGQTGSKRNNTHIVFDANQKDFSTFVEKDNSPPEQDGLDSDDNSMVEAPDDNPGESKVSKEFRQRVARERTLSKLARKMEVDQAVSRSRPIISRKTEEGKVVYKWKKERKK